MCILFFRFGKLFEDAWYLMAALSPVLEKSKTSLAEEFLLFDEIEPSGRPDDEVDRFLKDRDTSRFQMTYDVQIFSKSLKTLLRSEH